ncbi:MAG: hypothetical protein NTY38_01955 [Acidobacteria bacterium]|nr:hypothetical protein [Acidobacteriota bacterium]
MKLALFCLLLAAPGPELPAEIRAPRPVAALAAQLETLYGKPVTYEENTPPARSSRRLRLNAIPGWPYPGLTRKSLQAAVAWSDVPYRVEESAIGFHLIPAGAAALLDTRVTVPKESRTFLMTVEAICREVSRKTGVRLKAEWAGDVLNVSAEELYKGSMEPYLVWGVKDTRAREALVELLVRSKTSFGWVQRCSEDLSTGKTGCSIGITLLRRWTSPAEKTGPEVVLFDRCRDRSRDCRLRIPPPPPPIPAGSAQKAGRR